MATAATMRFLDVWYTRFDADKVMADLGPKAGQGAITSAQKAVAKAQTRTSLDSLSKFAQRVDGGYRIKQQPPVIVRPPETRHDDFEQIIRQGLTDYARTLAPDRRVVLDRYHFEDFARKVSGVGSVGNEAMMILLMGDAADDPLFLQIKEATTSVLAPYASASEYAHQGERVVQGQRLMQAASDVFLGWGHRHRRAAARVPCAPVARHEGLGHGRGDVAGAPGLVREALRRWRARTRARAHR